MEDKSYMLRPIGIVRAGADGFGVVIDEPFRAALTELEGFSHINILWWADQLDDPIFREMTISERPYKQAPAAVGIFATRSPARPNPIALTAAQTISIDVDSGLVRVAYIDADDGTPVLDLKPYLPATDRIRDASYPEWATDWPQWYEDSASFDWGTVFDNAR